MKILFISGAPSTGKTTVMGGLCSYFTTKGYSLIFGATPVSIGDDFECIYEKGDLRVMIHSATDNMGIIDRFIKRLSELGYTPDVLIVSIRDFDDYPRRYLCAKLGISNSICLSNFKDIVEFPLAKITRRNSSKSSASLSWYWQNVDMQIRNIMSIHPFYL